MHRSSSYYLSPSSAAAAAAAGLGASAAGTGGPSGAAGMDVDQLPTYDPRSDAAKKEALDASRADLARTLVHLIPVVVLLCGLILWSLSATDVPEVGILVEKGGNHKIVARARLMPQNSGSTAGSNESGMVNRMEDSGLIDKARGTKRRELW
ncbi:hypothetical protein ACP70R_037203 [Stipagrostis hirtigluma subsp. patula]